MLLLDKRCQTVLTLAGIHAQLAPGTESPLMLEGCFGEYKLPTYLRLPCRELKEGTLAGLVQVWDMLLRGCSPLPTSSIT